MKVHFSQYCTVRLSEEKLQYVKLCFSVQNDGFYTDRVSNLNRELKLNSAALARKVTIPTERPPLVGEVSASATDPHGR
jgi:hypothetical protein